MKRHAVWSLLFVSLLLTSGCATTGRLHTGADVSIDGHNGLIIGGNLVRRTVDEVSRSQGPTLFWQNRFGGQLLISHDGYTIPIGVDQGHVMMTLVCNCNPRSVILLRNGVELQSMHEGSWQLPLPNRYTNARVFYSLRVGCEEDPTNVVWERKFSVLSSGPRMDTGRRW